MIRLPENDALAELRPVAFDVIYRIGDRLFLRLTDEDARRLKGALTSIGDQRDMWAHQTPELIDHPVRLGT